MIKNGELYYGFDAAQYLALPKTATCHKMGVMARLGDVAGSITARFHLHHSGFGGEVLNTSSHPPSSRSGWKKGLQASGQLRLLREHLWGEFLLQLLHRRRSTRST